ncbi:zinc finger protein 793-like [Uranotaenia lowii]|uniref:zinc finger protein 793-like n=1 Tax=Uranotaenia lowii TaxID=190385 RepID=UPI002478B38C|nr:zinc finger protein 793-like [Uranotaenia lowii]
MKTRKKRSAQREPSVSEPLIDDEELNSLPKECVLMNPDGEHGTKKRKSRYVQVDMDDLNWQLDKSLDGHWKMDQEEEPMFLPGNVVIDSQCRCCLRKLDKSHLNLVERSLKTKMRLFFKIRVHPYDSYPFVCVNCTNLIHALADFRGTLVKAKILLRQEQTVLEEDNWVNPEHLAAAAVCRKMVDQHRKRIEEVYDAYQRRMKEDQNELEEPQEAKESTDKEEKDELNYEKNSNQLLDSSNMPVEEQTSVELKEEIFLPEAECSSESSDDESLAIFNNEDSDDVGYQPRNKSKKLLSNFDEKSNKKTGSGRKEDKTRVYPEKRKRGRPKKDGTESELKIAKDMRKPKAIKDPKPKPDPQDKTARQSLCPICGKSIHITVREAHMNQHNGIRPFKCPYEGCELSFFGKNYWSQHIKRMHGNNGGVCTHKCDICGKMIRGSVAHLKQHQARHAVTDKNVVCNVCGQTFWLLKYLKKHLIIHTDLFPYDCRYCGKKFKHKASKDTHEKNVHEKHNNFGNVSEALNSDYPQISEQQSSGLEYGNQTI